MFRAVCAVRFYCVAWRDEQIATRSIFVLCRVLIQDNSSTTTANENFKDSKSFLI